MASTQPAVPFVRFGKFEVDLRSRELRRNGVRIRLQDQPFQILALMLERAGEVVTRDELQARLWPEGTFVDFEHGVNAAVKRLRAALGDNADRPRFVETLPRRGYRFIAPIDQVPAASAATERLRALVRNGFEAAPGFKARLAVLPFADLNEGCLGEYFCDGLTSEMIAQLGRLCGTHLGVIARTSAQRYKASGKSAREIGRALRAQYLLEGSVRCDTDRIRITAQLIETTSETYLWADTYERPLADCFSVQAEVASRIAQSLALELLPGRYEAGRAGTMQPDAYQAYLKGLFHWNRPVDEGLNESIGFLERALAADPEFAEAAAVLARVHVAAAEYYTHEPRLALSAARRSAERALTLDPNCSEAHLALADVRKALDWDWSAAERAYRAALGCNPSSEAAHRQYALFLAGQGRAGEADGNARRAYDLDPLCLVVNTGAAAVRYFARDYSQAIERCRHTLDMASSFVPARRVLAASLVQLARYDEALAQLSAAGQDLDPVSLAWVAHACATAGERDAAVRAFDRLARLTTTRYVSAYHQAIAYVGTGDVERVFTLLTQACDARDPALIHVAVEPRFDPVRNDPRYGALLTQLRLEAVC